MVAKQKSDSKRPAWLANTPKSPSANYSFRVVESNGSDLPSSRLMARAELRRHISSEFNIEVSEEYTNSSTTTANLKGISGYTENEKYIINIKSDEVVNSNIHVEKIDEYYEVTKVGGAKVFKLYTLFAVSNVGKKPQFDTFRITDKYGARGLWRSAICPGWGQMYKGSKGKGITILLAEAAAIGGVIFCENERASYESKMLSQPHFMKTYKTKVDNFETARNCCIGAAAVIYVYNLIDAMAAPGAKRLSIDPSRVKLAPFATKDFGGFSLSYRF
jgi:hypothetical protein